MCDRCLDWTGDGVTLECLGCNAAGVLDGSIYEVDSDSREVCLDAYNTFVDERETDEENPGCEYWYL